ncbi:MAG: TrbI/VirB10 family protein [Neisseria sp.]|uniref:TrbI/VirB10 family protein n=1 Tax=Neisseria sp. TaxID=192066 RepID=UPI0026DA99C1|nr:TrbI/VirB10 family protein [Neisseria sp.]MDO4640702.1 TrbI/VirB10 family protein [Neisseria sp.]
MSDQFENNSDHNSEDGNNPYAEQYEKEQMSQLEENAPQLNNPIGQTINKKAIAFIAIAGLGVIGLMVFAYQMLQQPEEEQKVERAEVVTVPDLPPDIPQAPTSSIPLANNTAASQPKEERSHQPLNITPPPTIAPPSVVDTENYQPPTSPQALSAIASQQLDGLKDDGKESGTFIEGGATEGRQAGAASVRALPNRDKLLVQGTYLRCVLETKIISDVSGFTSCIITEPVYSANGQYSLIPKGSKVMGQYGSTNPVSPRLAVMWDRIITPDGLDITLRSPGVDNLGAAGHVGDLRTHWQSRLASALLISMISDVFKYAAAEYGPNGQTVTNNDTTVTNPYESETANTLKQMAINQLERNNSRPNTVTINQGTLINIYTAQDIDFNSVMQ